MKRNKGLPDIYLWCALSSSFFFFAFVFCVAVFYVPFFAFYVGYDVFDAVVVVFVVFFESYACTNAAVVCLKEESVFGNKLQIND